MRVLPSVQNNLRVLTYECQIGTAVYVNCVLARTLSGPTGFSDMSFFIDGELVGAFLKAAPGVDGYDYNVTVYSNTSLSAGLHTLIIQNGHINGNKSLLILDSVVYTYVHLISTSTDRPG